jgi:ATP-dependent Clp protease ATP-binding subunit ClpA
MARLIADHIKKPLADEILFGTLSKGGGVVHVSVKDDALALRCTAKNLPTRKTKKKELMMV